MDTIAQFGINVVEGAVFIGVCWFGYLTVKKGGGWAVTKLKSWWTAGKAEFAALEARVTALESKLGIKTAAPTPAAAPAAAAAAASTAAHTVAGVVQSPNSNA